MITQDQIKTIHLLHTAGYKTKDIKDHTGLALSTVHRVVEYLNIRGLDNTLNTYLNKEKLSQDQTQSIVKFIQSHSCTVAQAEAVFNVDRAIIDKEISRIKKLGTELTCEPAIPEVGLNLYFLNTHLVPQSTNTKICLDDGQIYVNRTDTCEFSESISCDKTSYVRQGRAFAPVQDWRPAKVYRRKDIDNIDIQVSKPTQHNNSVSQNNLATAFSKERIEQLYDNPEYCTTNFTYKGGRPSHINPYRLNNTTGIPEQVYASQCKQYQYEVSLQKVAHELIEEHFQEETFSNKVEKNKLLFKVALMLHERFPDAKDAELARAVGLSRATFSNYKRGNHSLKKQEEQSALIEAIRKIFTESGGTYGKKRITIALREQFNMYYCVPTIAKYMKLANVKVVPKHSSAKKYSSFEGDTNKVMPNLLKRDFSADTPCQKVVTDVTEFKVGEHKVYLSAYWDCFNNEIISYSLSQNPSVLFVNKSLEQALEVIQERNSSTMCIIHSDRGHQYQHSSYQQLIANSGVAIQSMSRKGNCYDNGACEQVFGKIKAEFNYHQFTDVNQFAEALAKFIKWFNQKRIVSCLGMSPLAYLNQFNNGEQQSNTDVA